MLTHPTYTVAAMSTDERRELTARFDSYAEVTAYQLLRQPGCDAAALAAFVAGVGYDHVILSSTPASRRIPHRPTHSRCWSTRWRRKDSTAKLLSNAHRTFPNRLVTP